MGTRLRKSLSHFILKHVSEFLEKFNIGIVARNELNRLQYVDDMTFKSGLQLISTMPAEVFKDMYLLVNKSYSQLSQDLFVIGFFKFKRRGFFVEFGATNGKDLSNTFLLESEFGWTGILAEPARVWHSELEAHRTKSKIDFSCVWKYSNRELDFAESDSPELSTLSDFGKGDSHYRSRENSKFYKVQSITLLDLLEKHSAPKFIEYLSIDTEGSEYEILSGFDFSQYEFGVISCEHNYSSTRDKVHELLTSKGYRQVLPEISRWDAWFVRKDLYDEIMLKWCL